MRVTRLIFKAKHAQTALVAEYKRSLTHVANPVVILTTGDLNVEPRGITVSSFTSVSISPQPLVAFNLQVPSRTSELMHSYGKFTASFLEPTEENAVLCRALAGQISKKANPFELFSSRFCQDPVEKVTTVKDAAIRLYCTKHEVFRVQDHEIWTGKVHKVEQLSSGLDTDHLTGINTASATSIPLSTPNTRTPMLYQKHHFHHLGEKIGHDEIQPESPKKDLEAKTS